MSQSFNCTYQDCTKTYNKKSRLDEHLNTHTLNKPFKCNKCPKSYYKKYHLQRHYFSHSGERRYACERCGSGHNERSKLREHEKKCGLKFVCEKCKRVFLREGRYRTHVCKISTDFDKENCNDNVQDANHIENEYLQMDDDTRYPKDLNHNYINNLDKHNKMNLQESKILSQDRSNNYINNLDNYKKLHLQNFTNISQGNTYTQLENNEHSLINAVVLSACSTLKYDILDDLDTQIKNFTNLIRKNNLHAFNAKRKLKINNNEIKIDKDSVKKAKLEINALESEQSFDDMVEMREISENQMNKNHNNNYNARRMYEMKHDNAIDIDSKNLVDKPTNSNNIIINDQTKKKMYKNIKNYDENKKNSEINDTNKYSIDKILFTDKINNSYDISNVTNVKLNKTSTIKDIQNNQNINNSSLLEKMKNIELKNLKKYKKNKNKNSLTCNNQSYDFTTEINEDNSGSKLNLNNNSFESDNSNNGINEIDEINKIFSLNSFETTNDCSNEIKVNKYKLPHVNDVSSNSLDNTFSKLYECLHCDKKYTTRKILKAHIDSVHISGKKHKCKCGKEYFYRHNLKQHEMKCQHV